MSAKSPTTTTIKDRRPPLAVVHLPYKTRRANQSPVIVFVLLLAIGSLPASRSFATAKCPPPSDPPIMVEIATYEEVKDLPNHPEKVLIDVREPDELKETGQIPTSINIPLASVERALSADISEQEFKTLYGRRQPECEQEIIFTCKTGRRAGLAADIAMKLGYTHVKNYKGSWTEWAEKNGL